MFKIKYLLPPLGFLILLIIVITQFRPPENLTTGPFLPLIIFFTLFLGFLISVLNLITKKPKISVYLSIFLTLILILKIFQQYILIGGVIILSLVYIYLIKFRSNKSHNQSQKPSQNKNQKPNFIKQIKSKPDPNDTKLKKIHRIG